jgi:4-alpha-glucanotransferase
MSKILVSMTERSAGVLLHISSLPREESLWGEHLQTHTSKGLGTLGKQAFKFIDFMADAGLRVWQMLPVVPTELSPYQALSVHAGNPDLISVNDLIERGWVAIEDVANNDSPQSLKNVRAICANYFYQYIDRPENSTLKEDFNAFCEKQSYWLNDFSTYSALRDKFNNASWIEWPVELRLHNKNALEEIRKDLTKEIAVFDFEQFVFFTQWQALRNYAAAKSIFLLGDMPIFVGHDSADVWAQQQYFQLDENGHPLCVAGVPPDGFSETGQYWGNPHYAWDVMEGDGFQWWLARLRTQLNFFDWIRIDHFRAFESFWSIPANARDAREGKWVKAPGQALLRVFSETYPELPLVAENLGLITDEVEHLRHEFFIPGMAVLQFAFDGQPDNFYLPHNQKHSDFVYTGTHDNDTTIGWYQTAAPEVHHQITDYCFNSSERMPWLFIQLALSSVANVCIIPMQDFLELDSEHRMNTPGTSENNWIWSFSWDQLPSDLTKKIKDNVKKYNRY